MTAMRTSLWPHWSASRLTTVLFVALLGVPLSAEPISLQSLVTPSTVISKDGHKLAFSVHGFVEFNSLAELFPYIESQSHRWDFRADFDESARRALRRDLLRRGIESRIVSMIDERPMETLITHTRAELELALQNVKESTPNGYAEEFIAVQEEWKHSLNCWSAAPSIPARVLSNWYPIQEGIRLYDATYDSTEHFWQAVKYHPDVTVSDIGMLLDRMQSRDWSEWLKRLDSDPQTYLPNAYAVEFLRHNLTRERLQWFKDEIGRQKIWLDESARTLQQRNTLHPEIKPPFRFGAYEEKVLWGDLADVFHLVYIFSLPDDPIRKPLAEKHFDAIYLGDRKMGFISEEFRSLMLEIWKVKYLEMDRFGEVIRSIPLEIRLSHFLNDGDSPDIPIPVYIGYLNQIRDMALAAERKRAVPAK